MSFPPSLVRLFKIKTMEILQFVPTTENICVLMNNNTEGRHHTSKSMFIVRLKDTVSFISSGG